MSPEQPFQLRDVDERTQRAVAELEAAISQRYPTTIFELTPAPDDPASLHLLAIADVDDPDVVGDLVLDRVVAMQVEEGIPLHVIPLRTPARIQAAQVGQARRRAEHAGRPIRLLGEHP